MEYGDRANIHFGKVEEDTYLYLVIAAWIT